MLSAEPNSLPPVSILSMKKTLVLLWFLLTLTGDRAQAQPYTWRNTLKVGTECVAFNPLSKGVTLFTSSSDSTGIFRSDDGGMTWVHYTEGMDTLSTPKLRQILCLETDTSILIAVSTSLLYRSSTGGRSWHIVLEQGGALGEAVALHRQTGNLYYGQNYKGAMWKSTDKGATWTATGPPSDIVNCTIAISPIGEPTIFEGSGEGAIARTTDEGQSWKEVYPVEDTNFIFRPEVPKIVFGEHAPNTVLATRWLAEHAQLVRSFDGGDTWHTIPLGQPRAWALEVDQRASFVHNDTLMRMWVGLFNRGPEPNTVNSVIETRDGGRTWLSTGLPELQQVWVMKYDTSSGRLAVATEKGVFVTTANLSVRSAPQADNFLYVEGRSIRIVVSGETMPSVAIYDLLGKLALVSNSTLVDVSGLPPGIYVASVVTSQGTVRTPFVLRH
jgi:photosystem II stability/assembly factor-like uncharacterized protein